MTEEPSQSLDKKEEAIADADKAKEIKSKEERVPESKE
jgi:hypothetical protein